VEGAMAVMIDLEKLDFGFTSKPLLIGGEAMAYYGLREAGADIDFVITAEDYERLALKYPDHLRDLGGDLGVCVFEFEIWKSICLFDYQFLSVGSIERDAYLIISLDRLLFLKALGMKVPKYHRDLELIVEKALQVQYEKYHEKKETGD
jgi:hypothetical protein